MSGAAQLSDREFFRSHLYRDHRVRRADANEIRRAKVDLSDYPAKSTFYAAVCRYELNRWKVAVFAAPVAPKQDLDTEKMARSCFIMAAAHAGCFDPEIAG